MKKSKNMPRVLFIDDQPDLIEYLVNELKDNGYEVDVIHDVVAAIDYLNKPPVDLVAIILDIIMPPGPFIDKDHNDGTETGKYLLEYILDMQYVQEGSGHPLPIAALTQVSDQSLLKEVEEIQIRARQKEKKFKIWSKYEIEPKSFPIEFQEWLKAITELYV